MTLKKHLVIIINVLLRESKNEYRKGSRVDPLTRRFVSWRSTQVAEEAPLLRV